MRACGTCGREEPGTSSRCRGCGSLLPPAGAGGPEGGGHSPGGGPEVPPPGGDLPPEVAIASGDPARRFGPPLPDGRPRYVRVELLGEGGLGRAWKTWDLNLVKFVAAKFIRGSFDRTDVEAFLAEGRLVAGLEHENIVPVLDVGVHDGQPFIVMQLVEGQTLASAAPPDERTVARWIRDAAKGLHFAHERGVVHSDLKPENLMVSRPAGGGERVMVLDFGLARVLGGSLRASLGDPAGGHPGTPEYMSPEQARSFTHPGAAGSDVDRRTDVYGLGATTYALLTGRPPFRGPVHDVLGLAASGSPAPLATLRPGCSGRIVRIVERAMARDPGRRYATALDLAGDLDSFLRAPDWRRLGRRAAAVAALAAVVGAVFVGVREGLRRAALSRASRAEEAEDWEGAVDSLEEVLRSDPSDREAGRRLREARHRLGWFDEVRTLPGTAGVSSLAFSPGGRVLAVGRTDGTITLWDAARGEEKARLPGKDGPVECLAFHPSGDLLASVGGDGRAFLWRLRDASLQYALEPTAGNRLRAIAVSPAGDLLATAGSDRVITLRDASTGEPRRMVRGHEASVHALAFDPRGDRLVSAGEDREIRLWNPATGTPEGTLEGHGGLTRAVAFSGDGRFLAAAHSGNLVRVWDVPSRGHLADLFRPRDSNFVTSLAFGRSGRFLASADGDGGVWLWDPRARAEAPLRRTLRVHGGPALVAFSPDTGMLATGGADGTVRLWTRRWRLETVGSFEVDPAAAVRNSWSLAVDPSGVVHVASTPSGELRYGRLADGVWTEESLVRRPNVGEASIATGADGRVHVAYSTMESEPTVHHSVHYRVKDRAGWRDERIGASDAVSPSLALDLRGEPHIAFTSAGDSLRHAWRDPEGAWEVDPVSGGTPLHGAPSLATARSGRLHAVAVVGGSEARAVRTWARNEDGTWVPADTPRLGTVPPEVSAVVGTVDGNGRLHLLFRSGAEASFRYWTDSGSPPEPVPVNPPDDRPLAARLDLRPGGGVIVHYLDLDADSGRVRVRRAIRD